MSAPRFAGVPRRVHEDLYKLIIGQLRLDGHEPVAQMLQHATGLIAYPSQRLESLVSPSLSKEIQKLQAYNQIEDDEKLDFEVEAGPKTKSSYKPIFFTSHKGPCYTAVFSHDGKYAATGSADTSVKLLDVEMMVAKRETKETANPCRHTLKEHKQPVTTVAFDFSDTKLVTGSQDGTIKFFDLSKLGRARQRSVCTISDSHVIHSIDYHPSSQYLLVGTSNPVVRLYDVTTQTCFASANELEYHSASVNHVAFSCDGKVYASASSDGSIKLWDGVSSRCIATFSEAHGQSSVDCVRISRNFKYLLSCGRDNIIRLWDLAMGQVLIAYEGGSHAKYGLKASFSHNERFVLGANDGSNTAVAWDTRTGEMEQGLVQPSIPGHAAPIREIATSPNVSGFLTATEDKTARYWHYS